MKNRYCTYTIAAAGVLLFLAGSCIKEEEEPETYSIGQNHAGGIVFYLDDTKQHGMVCAPSDQATAIPWSNGSDVVTDATGSDMGTGEANTEVIIDIQGAGSYAAQICSDLELNGYDDWFLPSKSECFNMYFNLCLMRKIGEFADELYWSSTEASVGNAYSQYGNDGYPPNGGYYKNSAYHVRAIRAF